MTEEKTSIIATTQDLLYLPTEIIMAELYNPVIVSPETEDGLQFYQTRDTLIDVERYKSFLDNAIGRFRRSNTYKCYKSYLMSLGMNRCQILGNVTEDMASIEMHHNFLTIFDISILISQHVLNTIGYISTFDLIQLIMNEHRANRIPIVMLSKTAHQKFHDDDDFYIPLSMTFGKWWELISRYRYGITLDIAYKIIRYLNKCETNNEISELDSFALREQLKDWSDYNEYTDRHFYDSGNSIGYNDNSIR